MSLIQDPLKIAFTPFRLRDLTLRNRFIKTATYEGMTPGGIPSKDLIKYHTEIAKGGIALTTVAYGAVNESGRTHENQLMLEGKSLPMLEKLVQAVHKEGGAASIQLTHCGFFSSNQKLKTRPLSPSRALNLYGLFSGHGISKEMTEKDLDVTRESFARAAFVSKELGFDAVELHMGHGYLLSQFLSPLFNTRKDNYGGNLKNRIRYPIRVLKEVRERVGNTFPIFCKLNLADGIKGGLEVDDSCIIVNELYKNGADSVVLSGGITSRNAFYLLRGNVPRREMARVQDSIPRKIGMKLFGRFLMKEYPYQDHFFMPKAKIVRKSTEMPLVYLGGVASAKSIKIVIENNFDLVAIGRALVHDPNFIHKIKENDSYVSPCNHCNECLVEMDKSGLKCVLTNT